MRVLAVVVLLNACLAASLPTLRLPDLPKKPDTPTVNPGGPDTINTSPGQNQPGRWPTGNDATPAEPGRLPPSTEKKPSSSCNGKKRMECVDDSRLNTAETDGHTALSDLDNVKVKPPIPSTVPAAGMMSTRYRLEVAIKNLEGDEVPEVMGDTNPENWTKFKIFNNDPTVDAFVREKKLTTTDPEELQVYDNLGEDLKGEEHLFESWTSGDGKSLVFERMFNERLDLYRPLDKDPDGFERYQRQGVGPNNAVRFTDQGMFSWTQAIGNRDSRAIGLERIVHKNIITDATNGIITAAMQRGKRYPFDPNTSELRIEEFRRGDDGFEAIMGTIHAKRTAQMLTDYHHVVGDRTIDKISVSLNFDNPEESHDMLITLKPIA
ncbi:hypothetical protein CC86DRAFT_408875 [Ophiobolus disseminans]|uniref:Calycin-like protein n=1 Tax=Ophiobolus disseminans TaxID=1469910 RepID=A0A6A6ZU59_9PLEO|nr:hypothetical protein CC86DRAFT_408875 [Ophiobolus disseminans]